MFGLKIYHLANLIVFLYVLIHKLGMGSCMIRLVIGNF
jgi:hypothetical protein